VAVRPGSIRNDEHEQLAVQERIELNQNLTPAKISSRVMHEMCRHALDTVPEECCGLITGVPGDRFRGVQRITNIMNKMHHSEPSTFKRDARFAYYMSEAEVLQALKDADEQGEDVTAVYHSHVGLGAYLSHEDIAYAAQPLFPFPAAAQIVISIVNDRVKQAAIFERQGREGEFDSDGGRLIEVVENGTR
jgi:proteasome lid subunit RPN8/RPN11